MKRQDAKFRRDEGRKGNHDKSALDPSVVKNHQWKNRMTWKVVPFWFLERLSPFWFSLFSQNPQNRCNLMWSDLTRFLGNAKLRGFSLWPWNLWSENCSSVTMLGEKNWNKGSKAEATSRCPEVCQEYPSVTKTSVRVYDGQGKRYQLLLKLLSIVNERYLWLTAAAISLRSISFAGAGSPDTENKEKLKAPRQWHWMTHWKRIVVESKQLWSVRSGVRVMALY